MPNLNKGYPSPTNKPLSTRQRGLEMEELAANFLEQQGIKIITRNFSCKIGEIDIIANDNTHLIFVEIRFRKNQRYGGALASINTRKQHKLIHTAQFFLKTKRLLQNSPCRFDVIAITLHNEKPSLEWVQNAFQAF